MAVACFDDNTVMIFFGDGSGGFGEYPDIIPVGASPHSIVVADFNSEAPQLVIEDIHADTVLHFTIKNVGNTDATNIEINVAIEGGFFILHREITLEESILTSGSSTEKDVSIFGVGLGIFTEIPVITIDVLCDEGASTMASLVAKIFLSRIMIQ